MAQNNDNYNNSFLEAAVSNIHKQKKNNKIVVIKEKYFMMEYFRVLYGQISRACCRSRESAISLLKFSSYMW